MRRDYQHRDIMLRNLRFSILAVLPRMEKSPLYDALRLTLTRIEDSLNIPHTYPTRRERRKSFSTSSTNML